MERIADIARQTRNIVIDNEVLYKRTPMTMTLKQARVDQIADKAVDMLGAPQSRAFFCKCAQHLSEDDIYSAIEYALTQSRIIHPERYVSRVLKQKLVKRGILD